MQNVDVVNPAFYCKLVSFDPLVPLAASYVTSSRRLSQRVDSLQRDTAGHVHHRDLVHYTGSRRYVIYQGYIQREYF